MEKLLTATFNSLSFRRTDSQAQQQIIPSVPLKPASSRTVSSFADDSSIFDQQHLPKSNQVQQQQQHRVVSDVISGGSGRAIQTEIAKKPLIPNAPLLLHSVPRHPLIPSTCPFTLKLECYLRLTNTDYTRTCERPFHSHTKKCPWIEADDEYYDTNLIIDRCEQKLSTRASHNRRRLDYDLSGERKTLNRALIAMLEDRTWWAWQLFQEVYENINDAVVTNGESSRGGAAHLQRQQSVSSKTWHALAEQAETAAKVGRWPKLVKSSLDLMWKRRSIMKDAYGHGIGRLPQPAVINIGLSDITALSDLLQENDTLFLLGDSPHTVDCFAFGLLAQMLYVGRGGVFHKHIMNNLPTLVRYVENMRLAIWPDWHELCTAAARRTTPSTAADASSNSDTSSPFDLTYGPTLLRMRRMRQYKPQTKLLSWRSQECQDEIEYRVADKLIARAMAEAQAEYEDEMRLLARYPHSPW